MIITSSMVAKKCNLLTYFRLQIQEFYSIPNWVEFHTNHDGENMPDNKNSHFQVEFHNTWKNSSKFLEKIVKSRVYFWKIVKIHEKSWKFMKNCTEIVNSREKPWNIVKNHNKSLKIMGNLEKYSKIMKKRWKIYNTCLKFFEISLKIVKNHEKLIKIAKNLENRDNLKYFWKILKKSWKYGKNVKIHENFLQILVNLKRMLTNLQFVEHLVNFLRCC